MSKPLIIDYYEFDQIKHETYLKSKRETFKLKCKYCTKDISAAIDVTSNWVTYLKTKHKEMFREYENKKKSLR